jgi:membrane-bound metal-dependent hydrolase YbcI (DUF457 family)
MWPWGHLAFGYVCYSLLVRLTQGRSPAGQGTILAVFGTQLPDLIDKPLAWTFGVLPSGRSLTHSLITLGIVLLIVGLYACRYDRLDLVGAFATGWGSHLLGDSFGALLSGEFADASFLAWPITPGPPYDGQDGILSHFADLTVSPWLLIQIGVPVVVLGGLWARDGYPGLAEVRSLGRRLLHRGDLSDS